MLMLTTVYRNVSSKSVFNHLTSALVWLGAVQDSVVYKQFKMFINNSNLNVGGCSTCVPTFAESDGTSTLIRHVLKLDKP